MNKLLLSLVLGIATFSQAHAMNQKDLDEREAKENKIKQIVDNEISTLTNVLNDKDKANLMEGFINKIAEIRDQHTQELTNELNSGKNQELLEVNPKVISLNKLINLFNRPSAEAVNSV